MLCADLDWLVALQGAIVFIAVVPSMPWIVDVHSFARNILSMDCLVYINQLEATSVIKVVYLMAKRQSSDQGISK